MMPMITPKLGYLGQPLDIFRRASGPVRARDLADRLEIAERTVYRDIAALQAMRVPIEGAAGVGYILRPGFDLPPLMFTADEVEAIVVGLALLGRTGDKSLERAAKNVSVKIAEALPDGRKASIADGVVEASAWHSIPPADIDIADLRAAIRDERKLAIRYFSLNGEQTRRTVRPVAVLYFIECILLAAWCELRNDFRHFRADRIVELAATGERFAGEGPSLRARWETSREMP